MEKRTLIQWDDSNVVEVLIGIGKWDGESEDDHIFYWMASMADYQVGYRNGDGWTIIQIEKETALSTKWTLNRPELTDNHEQVVVGIDYNNERSDFNLARVQFVELYNGVAEPYFHISFTEAMCYSVAAKELLGNMSYKLIYVPGAWGGTLCWIPIHRA